MSLEGPRSLRCAAASVTAAVIALLLAALGVLAIGCGQSSNPAAQRRIDVTNNHIADSAAEIKAVQELNSQYQALVSGGEVTRDTANSAILLLGKAKTAEQKALADVQAAEKALSGVKKMKVSSDMKKYVDIKLQAIGELESFLTYELSAMDLRLQVMQEQKAGKPLDTLMELQKKIETLQQTSEQHAKEADKLNKEAGDFYQEKKLGE